MRKIRLPIIMAAVMTAIMAVLAACSGQQHSKPVLAVTIAPQKYLLEQIVGDRYEVISLLTPDANPETFDPSAASLMSLQRSPLYFRVGTLGFEQAALTRISENFPDMQVVDCSKGIKQIGGTHAGPDGFDPHIWTSVRNARVMARNMADALIAYEPKMKGYYTRRLNALDARLQQLDSAMMKRMEPYRGKAFIIKHPSLSYFAADYGLEQITLEHGGKEPSPRQMRDNIERAGRDNVMVFFIEQGHDNPALRDIAKNLNIPVAEISLLDYDWERGLNTIADAFANNKSR